jgi:hypothetical protein
MCYFRGMSKQNTNGIKPRITKEVSVRFYVELGDWIQAGPFDTREEAKAALEESRRIIGAKEAI